MRVSDLQQGMMLRINRDDYFAWIPETYTHWTGESELRFVSKPLSPILKGRKFEKDVMIIYLGTDTEELPRKYRRRRRVSHKKETIRRVMIDSKTAVVKGHNFKFLEPHPDFV